MWGVVGAALVVSGFLVRDGLVKFRSYGRSVSVRGLAERTVKSNEAKLTLSYIATGPNLQEVHARVARSQELIAKFLSKSGFAPAEIERGSVTITDNRANSYGSNKDVDRYAARGSYVLNSVRVDEVTQTSQRSNELLKDGIALEGASLSYYFTDLNSIKPQMLKEAIANARDAAVSFASDAGAKLGDIKSASQGLFGISARNSDYDSGSSITKKVRVVSNVEYYLE